MNLHPDFPFELDQLVYVVFHHGAPMVAGRIRFHRNLDKSEPNNRPASIVVEEPMGDLIEVFLSDRGMPGWNHNGKRPPMIFATAAEAAEGEKNAVEWWNNFKTR